MRRLKIGRRILVIVPALTWVALAFPVAAHAVAKPVKPGRPKVSTGGVTAVRGTSATLVGSVGPRGFATTYFFQYGPTPLYGKQTTPSSLPAGTAKVKIGQVVSGLLPGYHYRLVATNASGTTTGRDRTYLTKALSKPKVTIPKSSEPTPFGGTFVLTGSLTGPGNANRALVLQSSPFPFLTAFTTIGLPVRTDAAGRFSFRVASLKTSTQFRVSTLDSRPLYSRTLTQSVAVRVTLKVRSSAAHKGLVRLYGTVTPAIAGAHVDFQLRTPVRPGNSEKSSERTTKFATKFRTTVKRGTKTVARFSAVVSVRSGGRYRAYVDVGKKKSAVVSGSSATVVLKAAPATGPAKKKKH